MAARRSIGPCRRTKIDSCCGADTRMSRECARIWGDVWGRSGPGDTGGGHRDSDRDGRLAGGRPHGPGPGLRPVLRSRPRSEEAARGGRTRPAGSVNSARRRTAAARRPAARARAHAERAGRRDGATRSEARRRRAGRGSARHVCHRDVQPGRQGHRLVLHPRGSAHRGGEPALATCPTADLRHVDPGRDLRPRRPRTHARNDFRNRSYGHGGQRRDRLPDDDRPADGPRR